MPWRKRSPISFLSSSSCGHNDTLDSVARFPHFSKLFCCFYSRFARGHLQYVCSALLVSGEHVSGVWAERKMERSRPKTAVSRAEWWAGFKKSSGAERERSGSGRSSERKRSCERDSPVNGAERWAGNFAAPLRSHALLASAPEIYSYRWQKLWSIHWQLQYFSEFVLFFLIFNLSCGPLIKDPKKTSSAITSPPESMKLTVRLLRKCYQAYHIGRTSSVYRLLMLARDQIYKESIISIIPS